MAAGSAVRNRSPIVDVTTPRGQIQVARQEMKGLSTETGELHPDTRTAAPRKARHRYSELASILVSRLLPQPAPP